MCGICGIVSTSLIEPNTVQAMNQQLVHRGPDGAGSWQTTTCQLGHRRLAIIDLATGDQPLSSPDGAWQLVFNGEIYNFRALRQQLHALGQQFRTNSDTEVLLAALIEWGEQALPRLEGMFAFAAWHAPSQRLWLARDRLGKKPLYYSQTSNGLVFGSEIKALLAYPELERSLNPQALSAYLTYGYVPNPATWYAQIQQLAPGHALVWQAGSIREWPWWQARQFAQQPRLRISAKAAIAQTRQLVRAAVEKRLISDVPLGAFLSGGLDSSIVVAEAQALLGQQLQTFSIGFAGGGWYDESAYAELVAKQLGTKHHCFMVEPDAIAELPHLLKHYDEPFLDSSALPMALLSQMTREHCTVALSGDGGDEVFAGYERFGAGLWTQRYHQLPQPLRRLLEQTIAALPETKANQRLARIKRVLAKIKLPLAQGFPRWLMAFTPEELAAWGVAELQPSAAERYRQATAGISDPLAQLLCYNLGSYLPDDLLVKADRMSMAYGLEVRSPFLDQHLVEWALQLPAHLLWRGGRGKWLLRQAYAERLPKIILERPKHGFGVPLDAWFRQQLKPMLHDYLLADTSKLQQWLAKPKLEQLCKAHWAGTINAGHQLWTFLSLELWLQTHHQMRPDAHNYVD
ncbi:asparagine synthase (glutamine-hydrolyzing) [Herpetosiphon llansteffanensis]|uniref:asparagine synthase (glutamine-hydrolyzing) n=1 Tax=Herpetosiphon llansteffanensis TaxID=2094568 RepID=UPI0013E0D117|nr:asparagine synthase (glutamine-hydrolyzing) [Herpetosiphon llansteffanensis]